MAGRTSSPTRVNADIAAIAASVAPAANRTIAEQINYWARLGMQLERAGSLEARRILAATTGQGQFSALTDTERVAAHALVDARIAERSTAEAFGPAARAAGQTTVSIDDDGRLVEISPDGTHRAL